jgi:hypothetical protein
MPRPLCAPQYLTEERFLAIPKEFDEGTTR